MSDESHENRLLRLIDEEERAFESARRNAETAGPAQRENLSREWFKALAAVLRQHHDSHILPSESDEDDLYPTSAIGRAAYLFEAFSAGCLPQPVTDLNASGGRPERWPGAKRDIATAVHYLELAKSNEIQDKAYNVTVAKAFQVDRTTVQNWFRDRDEICSALPKTPAHRFPEALTEAGARFHFNRKNERTDGAE